MTFQVPGAPEHELRRSPAAAAVGRLASESGLRMAHYEYRVTLDPPEWWLPRDRPDLGTRASWQFGVLPESKYQSFRNDLMIGSFHPGHRAKWTAHELCHGLVGFAWRSDASPLFHALSARLSELLPVALFYFFDEAFLERCPDHIDQGPLFNLYCQACEAAATRGPRDADPMAEVRYGDGKAFVERELEAIHRSVAHGRPIASPWGNLDLCSDGLAYAAVQSGRLVSPEYVRFIEMFYPPATGCHGSLHALEERVREVMAMWTGEGAARPWPVTRVHWECRDLGWRLLEIGAQTEGGASEGLDRLAVLLADRPAEPTIEAVIAGYRDLHAHYDLPDPEDVFAVGYPLPGGLGRSVRQIAAGIESACPMTREFLGEQYQAVVRDFVGHDRNRREPLGVRFASWLADVRGGHAGDLAAFEAAVAHAPTPDLVGVSLRDGRPARGSSYRLSPSVRLLRTSWDVLATIDITGETEEQSSAPLLVIRRDETGEPKLVHPEPHIAAYLVQLDLAERDPGRVDDAVLAPAELAQLVEMDLIVPKAWRL